MSGNLEGFDASKVEPNVALTPIPAGDYEAIIASSEIKTNSKGTGDYLELVLQVTKGPFQNRKLWDRLNINNQNAEAQKIARGNLSAICRAVGVLTPKDSSELHNRPLLVKVVVKKDQEYGDKNEVKGYKERTIGGTPAAAGPPPVSAGAPSKPW